MSQIGIFGDVSLHGALVLDKDTSEFPENPRVGTIIIKDQCLYAYIRIGDLETWYPFANKTNSYVHTQAIPNLTWTVNHNLGTDDVWVQVRDTEGNIIYVNKTTVNNNTFTLTFTTAIAGSVVVVAPDTIDVPQVKSTEINVQDVVIIDSSGVRINGSYALTSANISADISAAIADVVDGAPENLNTLNELAAAINDDPVYFQTVSDALETKADKSTTYTKVEVDSALTLKQDVMSFSGTNGISTSVSGSAVTVTSNATSANTASTIVTRDASGNFSAGIITATLSGNASTASTLQTSRTITLSGDVTGSVSFDGSSNVSISTTISANSIELGTDTTGNYIATVSGTTNQINVTGSGSENASITLALPQDIHSDATPTFAGLNIGQNSISEYIADTIGSMVTSNTESGISVTYDDSDNTLDFDVSDFTITLTGDVTGTGTVTNLGNVSFETTIAPNSVALGTDTTGDYVASVSVSGVGLSASGTGEGASVTITSNATSANTASTVVSRDSSGNFSAGTITATLSGNASTATSLQTPRTITLSGDVTGSVSFDGSSNVSISTTIAANSIALGTDTTGNFVASVTGTTNQINVTGSGEENAAVTLSLPQNINIGATPQFAGATLNDVLIGLTYGNEISTGSSDLRLNSATGKVVIDDVVEITGNTTIAGNLVVNGTTITANSTTVTIDDPVFTLGGDTAPSVNDAKDRGIEFRYHTGTVAKVGFFGYDDSTGKFTFIPDAINSGEVFSGTKGTIDANIQWSDVLGKPTRSDWVTVGALNTTVGQLAWKNYGNDHTIIDASAGTAPDGSSIGASDSANAWAPTLPVLMGWNGVSTYGVRVDSSRISDTSWQCYGNSTTATALQTSRTIWGQSFDGSTNISGNLTSVGSITGSATLSLVAVDSNVITAITSGSEALRITSSGDVGIGTTTPAHKLEVNGSFAATSKSFLIDHPTKEGMKLCYGSLEGPEHGVYHRGKVKGRVIELPEYWTKLIDPDTITVQLTAIGKFQNLLVTDIKDNVVYIDDALGQEPECFYLVHAERIDVEKIVVEI